MSFDFKKTLELVKGGLLDPAGTASSYLGESRDWQQTLVLLTGPLLLVTVVLSTILSRIVGTMSPYGLGGSLFGSLVLGLVFAAIGFGIAVLVFNFLAGPFGGKPDFSRAFAALSLAAIPAWIASVIGSAIPWLGGLISLAGGIYSLVLLYRVLPLALGVPQEKRVLHFVVSLVAMVVISMVIGAVFGVGEQQAVVTG